MQWCNGQTRADANQDIVEEQATQIHFLLIQYFLFKYFTRVMVRWGICIVMFREIIFSSVCLKPNGTSMRKIYFQELPFSEHNTMELLSY